MTLGINFFKIDLIIQKILLTVYAISAIMGLVINSLFMIALIIQLVLGIWHVLSAIAVAVFNKDQKRRLYLVIVTAYFIMVGLVSYSLSGSHIPGGIFLPILGIILIPMSIAVWYFWITLKSYQESLANQEQNTMNAIAMEHILDSEEMYRN